jgi:hypothetical protein
MSLVIFEIYAKILFSLEKTLLEMETNEMVIGFIITHDLVCCSFGKASSSTILRMTAVSFQKVCFLRPRLIFIFVCWPFFMWS